MFLKPFIPLLIETVVLYSLFALFSNAFHFCIYFVYALQFFKLDTFTRMI